MKTVTITSQGQITLPVQMRKALNLKGSDKLNVYFNPETRQISLEKPMTLEDFDRFSKELTKRLKPGIKPVKNVDAYYQKYRHEEMR